MSLAPGETLSTLEFVPDRCLPLLLPPGETLSTLEFVARAKCLVNHARVNRLVDGSAGGGEGQCDEQYRCGAAGDEGWGTTSSASAAL